MLRELPLSKARALYSVYWSSLLLVEELDKFYKRKEKRERESSRFAILFRSENNILLQNQVQLNPKSIQLGTTVSQNPIYHCSDGRDHILSLGYHIPFRTDDNFHETNLLIITDISVARTFAINGDFQ